MTHKETEAQVRKGWPGHSGRLQNRAAGQRTVGSGRAAPGKEGRLRGSHLELDVTIASGQLEGQGDHLPGPAT